MRRFVLVALVGVTFAGAAGIAAAAEWGQGAKEALERQGDGRFGNENADKADKNSGREHSGRPDASPSPGDKAKDNDKKDK